MLRVFLQKDFEARERPLAAQKSQAGFFPRLPID